MEAKFPNPICVFTQTPWKWKIASAYVTTEMYGRMFCFKRFICQVQKGFSTSSLLLNFYMYQKKKCLLITSIKKPQKQNKPVKLRWEFNINYSFQFNSLKCSAVLLLSTTLAKFTICFPMNTRSWEGKRKYATILDSGWEITGDKDRSGHVRETSFSQQSLANRLAADSSAHRNETSWTLNITAHIVSSPYIESFTL